MKCNVMSGFMYLYQYQDREQLYQPKNSHELCFYRHIFFPLLTPGDPLSILHHCDFVFSVMLQIWDHTRLYLLRPASFIQCNVFDIQTMLHLLIVHSILFTARQFSVVWMYHSFFFIHSPLKEHLGHCQFGTIMNRNVINTMHRFFQKYILSFLQGKYQGVALLGHMPSVCSFIFLTKGQIIS